MSSLAGGCAEGGHGLHVNRPSEPPWMDWALPRLSVAASATTGDLARNGQGTETAAIHQHYRFRLAVEFRPHKALG